MYLDMSPFIAVERSTMRCEQSFSGNCCHLCLVSDSTILQTA